MGGRSGGGSSSSWRSRPVLQDRLHTLVRTRIQIAGPRGSGFQTIRAVGFPQTQNAQTTAEALFGMRTGLKDLIDQSGGGWADGGCPSNQTFGRPFQVALMGLGSMRIDGRMAADLGAAGMTGDALAAVEDLDGHGGVAHVELAVEQSIRNAVVVPFDFDVIVDVDARLFPLGKRSRLRRVEDVEQGDRSWRSVRRGCPPACETGGG